MIITGDALKILPTLPAESVQCCVTSPPYWGLRDYGIEPTEWPDGWVGCFGLEPEPEMYVQHSVLIFREVRRVLRNDGCLWINLGDSYAGNRSGNSPGMTASRRRDDEPIPRSDLAVPGLKPKDLCMVPFRVAMALQSDGWWLRSVCPWIKRNSMPESCKDRPTQAVEYIFLLTKSERYYYDHEAVKLEASFDTHARYARGRSNNHKWADGGPGGQSIAMTFDHMLKPGVNPKAKAVSGWDNGPGWRNKQNESFSAAVKDVVGQRARRNSDWFFDSWQGLLSDPVDGNPLAFIINPRAFKEAHFATFPDRLVEPMILAGSRPGDTVLDPFSGSGTTGNVAERLGRQYIGIDINPTYNEMGERRVDAARLPLFQEAAL
jgi:DNA modification methylase